VIRSLLLNVAIATIVSATPALAHSEDRRAAVTTVASQALHRLFDQEWERSLRESPEGASYRGDKRYNDRWTDDSLTAIAGRGPPRHCGR